MHKRLYKEAVYRDKNITETVSLEKIISDPSKYKGHIYCPNTKCVARLKYVNRISPILQAMDITEHIDNCPYYSEYTKYDTDQKLKKLFSDEHIIGSLKRHIKKYGLKEKSILQTNRTNKKDTKKIHLRKQDEPNILSYDCTQVNDNLKGKPFCIGGNVMSVNIVDNEKGKKHAYINYVRPDGIKIAVLIHAKLFSSDPNIENQIIKIKERHKSIEHNQDKTLVCVCFGRIDKVEKGYNVVPHIFDAIEVAVVVR